MLVDFKNLTAMQRQQWLQHAVAPRPICFASTIDKDGNVNLSPFSFFNLFSAEPPIVVFSPSRRVRDNTIKHTLQNVEEVPEVVINICDYSMVQQISLASCEFPKGVNEFEKAGFTMEPALLVKPPMVQEAKIKLECKVIEIKALGHLGGAGNLVICEVLQMHVAESILNEAHTMIDQQKMEHVARLGGDWYCVVNNNSLFKVDKPTTAIAIGIDALPYNVKNSLVLTGNELAMLANVTEVPAKDEQFIDKRVQSFANNDVKEKNYLAHEYVKELLAQQNINLAWQVLLHTA